MIIHIRALRILTFSVTFVYYGLTTTAQIKPFPPSWYKEIFATVQMLNIFPDNKTFADATPLVDSATLVKEFKRYRKNKVKLEEWVKKRFNIPRSYQESRTDHTAKDIHQHIDKLWSALQRDKDKASTLSTLIPLPHKYIVPGGRFREIYYWDSYFSMLGLSVSNQYDMIESMIKNFAYLINTVGYIPNGNRQYFAGRSQPPFFAKMVELLASHKGPEVLATYLTALEKEYHFWMNGTSQLHTNGAYCRVVKLIDGTVLNRYYSDVDGPRPEGYSKDVEIYESLNIENKKDFYRHLRSACESGWDFSSRWMKNNNDLASIETMNILPVDLNCLMYELENILREAYLYTGKSKKASRMQRLMSNRLKGIRKYFWNEKVNCFVDYHWKKQQHQDQVTAAALYPLWIRVATKEQANKCLQTIQKTLWGPLGVATTSITSGQQWDEPNGWAPLQWIHYVGLANYGYHNQATLLARKWLKVNEEVYQSTGKMMEKYNVKKTGLLDGGGEYPNQDGFGWTNGVYQALRTLVTKESDFPIAICK